MNILWHILYGLIVLCETTLASENDSSSLQGMRKVENVVRNYDKKDIFDSKHRYSKSNSNKLKKKECLYDIDIGPIHRIHEHDVRYHESFKDDVPTFLYHKTLKKVQGRPKMIKDSEGMLVDSRIRVNPVGFEPFQHLDFPLKERPFILNNLNDVAGIHLRNNEDQVTLEKLKGFLKEAIEKSHQNVLKIREGRHANTTDRNRKPGQTMLGNKSEYTKLLEASYPLLVSLSSGGLMKNLFYKESDRKFRPEEFILGISSDPSFSFAKEAELGEMKVNSNKNKNENSFNKTDGAFLKENYVLLGNNASGLSCDLASLNKSLDQERSLQRIDQSAEEIVLKNVLNELIADIPCSMNITTQPGESQNMTFFSEFLKDTSSKNEIDSLVKSSKHNAEESTSKPNDNGPRMKIRVKNGPVMITFQSQVRRGSTEKPFTDPSNKPVIKIKSDQANTNKFVLIDTDSLYKNLMSSLTDELSNSDFGKDLGGKAYISSKSAYNMLRQPYFIWNPYANLMNNSGIIGNEFNPNTSLISSKFNNNSKLNSNISNYSRPINGNDFELNNKDNFIEKAPYGFNTLINTSYCKEKNDESMEQRGRTYTFACPLGYNGLIIPNYFNDINRFGLEKYLFLKRYDNEANQFANDSDRFKYAAPLSHTSSESSFMNLPKLYYNELVVSKGLVGKHPLNDDITSAVLSDSTLKKMEMLNILKFYLDSISPESNNSLCRNKEAFISNPMFKNNKNYFIKL